MEKQGLADRSWQTKFLFIAAPEQRCEPAALPICRAQLVATSGQGTQLAGLPDLGPQPTGHPVMKLILGPAQAEEQV